MREAMVHLLARYLEMRPLFLAAARPMKVEWKMRPYLGVFPRVLRALCGTGGETRPVSPSELTGSTEFMQTNDFTSPDWKDSVLTPTRWHHPVETALDKIFHRRQPT